MIHTMLTDAQLREILLSMEGVAAVQIEKGRRLVAFVQASHFRDMEEGARQAQVWNFLRDKLPPEQLDQVEFVFTDTPEERRETTAGSD